MTNEQILKKAIEKANKVGWNFYYDPETIKENCKNWVKTGDYFKLIFSHDFAKAIWGELKIDTCECGWYKEMKSWEMHLRQMVLFKEPLKYIEKFL